MVNYIGIGMEDKKYVNSLIEEAKEIGKVPWSCDGIVQDHLVRLFPTYDIETMEETCKRRELEEV